MTGILLDSVLVASWGIVVIGLISLLGHALNVPRMATWGSNIGMAIPTATCMVLIGFCLGALAICVRRLHCIR